MNTPCDTPLQLRIMTRLCPSWAAIKFALLVCMVTISLRAGVDLFDSRGNSAGLLDEQGRLVDLQGKVTAFIKSTAGGPAMVYDTGGKQIGWFKDGALHDLNGKVLMAASYRHMGVTAVPPVRAVPQVAPVQPVAPVPAVAPILSTGFADARSLALHDAQVGGITQGFGGPSMVLPRFNAVEASSGVVDSATLAAVHFAGIYDGDQEMRRRAASHEQRRREHADYMASAQKQLALAQGLLRRQEEELAVQEAQLSALRKSRVAELAVEKANLAALENSRRVIGEARAIVFSEPSGALIVRAEIPQLGLEEGDVLFVSRTFDDDTALTDGRVERLSVERVMLSPGEIKLSVPLPLVAALIRSGTLVKGSLDEVGKHLSAYSRSLDDAVALCLRLKLGESLMVSKSTRSITAPDGEPIPVGTVLGYGELTKLGCSLSPVESDVRRGELRPIRMRQLLSLMQDGALSWATSQGGDELQAK